MTLRRFLALLIVFGLAIAPVAGALAYGNAPATNSMEDCAHGSSAPMPADTENKTPCPGCDDNGQCTSVNCVATCLLSVAILERADDLMVAARPRIERTLEASRADRSLQPQAPPPRI